MNELDYTLALWDYFAEHRVRINNLTAGNIFIESNALIERRWGTSISPPPKQSDAQEDSNDETRDNIELYTDKEEEVQVIPDIEDAVDINGNQINQQPLYNRLINTEVQMQHGDEIVKGYVRRQAIGPDGNTAGVYDHNPHHDSIVYKVEFPDGYVKEYAANVIA